MRHHDKDMGCMRKSNIKLIHGRILVVDDMPENRKVIRVVLTKWGYLINEASDGTEAIKYVDQYKYDHVFMDLNMDGMNGFDAVQLIRKNERELNIPRLKISALTTYNSDEVKMRCLNLGFDNFFTKPTLPNTLLQALTINKEMRNLVDHK